MKSNLEDISPVKKRLKVEVLPDIVSEARNKALQEIQKKAEMPGFRQGKVPKDILEKNFLSEIHKVTIEEIVDQTLIAACQQLNVRPISAPEIEPGLWQGNGGFSYHAAFEVLPEIKIAEKDYKGLKLEKEEVEVSKEEMEGELKHLQEAMTQLEPLPPEMVLGSGHVAILDYTGTLEGKPFKGGEAKDFPVEVGSGNLLKDFEGGLLGAKAGETRTVRFTYPADYFNKELAGKKGEFQVTVKSVRKKNVPGLDDEFAKDLGDFKSLDEVKENIKKQITANKEADRKNHLCNQALEELSNKIKFEVPQSLVYGELRHMLEEMARDMEAQGEDIKKLDVNEAVKNLTPGALFRVRTFLILHQLCEAEKVDVTDAEIEARLENIAKGARKPLPEIKAYYEKNRLIASLKTRMAHEKVLEIVLNQAKIKVVKVKKEKK